MRAASQIRLSLRACQRLVPPARGGVTLLGYHLVGAGTGSSVDLPIEIFKRQLGELACCARVLPLDDAVDRLARGATDERAVVVLTFDDGYENFYTTVWPILCELGLPVSLYVQVDFLEGNGSGPLAGARRLAPLSWAQLAEMAASEAVTIGSHTLSHPDLRGLGAADLRRELEGSRRRLEDRLGRAVDSFCYPRGQWSRSAERVVAEFYRTAVIRGGRTMSPARYNPLRLERVPVRRDMSESLRPVVESSIWLEEWAASRVRRLLP